LILSFVKRYSGWAAIPRMIVCAINSVSGFFEMVYTGIREYSMGLKWTPKKEPLFTR